MCVCGCVGVGGGRRVGLTDSAPFEAAVHGLAAALGVWLLGGNFRALCPSSIMHVGAFANHAKSIPAKRFVHASKVPECSFLIRRVVPFRTFLLSGKRMHCTRLQWTLASVRGHWRRCGV